VTWLLVPRACPVCGSRDESTVYAESTLDESRLDAYAFASRKVPEYMHLRLVQCPTCDLLYANPAPDPSALATAYHDAAFDSAEEAGYGARTYGRLLGHILPNLPDRTGALDIGTGDGAFLGELVRAGFTNVHGVEPSAAPVAAAKPDIRPLIRQGVFRSDDYPPASMSLVTCFQTFEHLHDPRAMCGGVFRLLKPGGAAFFIGHNARAASVKLLGRKSPIFDIEHLQLFSPTSARYMMSAEGFEDVRVTTVVNRYPLHYWVKLFPMPRGLKRPTITALKATRIGYLPIPVPAGNMAVVGQKPRRPTATDPKSA
jgi:SAM-dependent methyltransferase